MSLFRIGQPVAIQHQKPWKPGKPILLRGTVGSFDGWCLIVDRHFSHPGQLYDGLPATQKAGDHGTVELRREAWVSRRRYLRADGELIGELYNIQTPTSFAGDTPSYVDLEIDVAYIPRASAKVVLQDVKELEAAVRWHFIPREMADVARRVAAELVTRLRDWDGGSEPDWDFRPEGTPTITALTLLAHRWPGALKIPHARAA